MFNFVRKTIFMKQIITKLLTFLFILGCVTACSGQKSATNLNKKSSTTQKTTHKKAKKTKTSTRKTAQKPSEAKNVAPTLLATEPYKTQVIATYYHDKFNGRKTANGTIFDNSKQTAAHRTLPFGTKLKVINRVNGKWIYVTVNDRGPVKTTREIDLTKRAFMDITDNKNKGELVVDIEIVK